MPKDCPSPVSSLFVPVPKIILTACFIALSLTCPLTSMTSAYAATPVAKQAQAEQNQMNPEITVYNQNFALVKDYRTLSLNKGENTIMLDDVAGLIDPTTVHFKSLTAPQSVVVREQNFKYDLITKNNILDRMVGKKIKFRKDGVIKEGILLNPATSFAPQNTYYPRPGFGRGNNLNPTTNYEFAIKTDEGVLLTGLSDIIVDQVPEDLFPRPTLAWKLQSSQGGEHRSEVSYLTDGMSWNCDYVAVVNQNDSQLDLTAWVTLNNNTGATYENARLKLVAGDVNRVQPGGGSQNRVMAAKRMAVGAMESDGGGFKEENFFEYHLYTLQGRTTLANNETKQMTMVSANTIPVQKKYIYDPDRTQYVGWLSNQYYDGYYGTFNYYYNRPGGGLDTNPNKKVNTMLQIKNSEANHLGIPLPKGKIRVNKADSSGSLQFVGEDWIDHTAKDETIELYLGDAFDLVGEKKRTQYHRESDYVEETYEVKLRNHKKEAVTVQVFEHLFGDWSMKMTSPGMEYKKEDAHTVSIPVTIGPDQEVTASYTVRIKRT